MEQMTVELTRDGHIRPLADIERDAIVHAYQAHAGNITRAAAALGISRRTLYNKLDEYKRAGLTFEVKREVSVVVSQDGSGNDA